MSATTSIEYKPSPWGSTQASVAIVRCTCGYKLTIGGKGGVAAAERHRLTHKGTKI